ncbi:hypothetical protein [Pseudonocardia sp. MH-G8]|uniref:hypothetical protein n=1 Tax=Pseudonocardia sp. MH-G8 TaxID=1854588 RepID=UPI000BA12669|nr:hypothetical protein [Pseudonocardia sp. MH-G8]OZM81199.1 hypothetical protein CFP66_17665 [Pseudonocardia sp. MH-G8]
MTRKKSDDAPANGTAFARGGVTGTWTRVDTSEPIDPNDPPTGTYDVIRPDGKRVSWIVGLDP